MVLRAYDDLDQTQRFARPRFAVRWPVLTKIDLIFLWIPACAGMTALSRHWVWVRDILG